MKIESKTPKAPQPSTKKKKIKRVSTIHKFFIMECQEDADLGKLAEELIAINGVEEVNIGEGDDDKGILVKTKLNKERDDDEFLNFLRSRIKGKYGKLISYYSVKK